MTRTGKQRLSRPLYEGLPWIYVAGGAVALAGSYFCPFRALSIPISLLGLLAVLGGVVVLLRRRDYRAPCDPSTAKLIRRSGSGRRGN